MELENYNTASSLDQRFERAEFRHELEIGITNRLQLGLYVANWDYSRRDQKAHYESASVEAIYNLSNPAADPLGISVYQELSGGRRLFESESKLIAQKNLGPLILLYNLTIEAAWTDETLQEREGELQQAFGASYELHPRVSIGAEILHELLLPDWKRGDQNLFIGPNVSYRSNAWFATLTALKQLTNTADEADYQVRVIFGIGL